MSDPDIGPVLSRALHIATSAASDGGGSTETNSHVEEDDAILDAALAASETYMTVSPKGV